jgi:methionyl-tRNA formyltransferase
VLDQRLLRDDPELIRRQLSRRGVELDPTLQFVARKVRDLEEKRSDLQAQGNQLVVACGSGALQLHELQLPGGRRIGVADFLQRQPVPLG